MRRFDQGCRAGGRERIFGRVATVRREPGGERHNEALLLSQAWPKLCILPDCRASPAPQDCRHIARTVESHPSTGCCLMNVYTQGPDRGNAGACLNNRRNAVSVLGFSGELDEAVTGPLQGLPMPGADIPRIGRARCLHGTAMIRLSRGDHGAVEHTSRGADHLAGTGQSRREGFRPSGARERDAVPLRVRHRTELARGGLGRQPCSRTRRVGVELFGILTELSDLTFQIWSRRLTTDFSGPELP